MTTTTLIYPTSKFRSYKSFFNSMTGDILLIPKYAIDYTDETVRLKDILVYWNRLVHKSYFWMKVAKEELNQPSIDKIHRYLRTKMLTDCHRAIEDTNKCKTSNYESFLLKRKLLDEYEDRLIYIKQNF